METFNPENPGSFQPPAENSEGGVPQLPPGMIGGEDTFSANVDLDPGTFGSTPRRGGVLPLVGVLMLGAGVLWAMSMASRLEPMNGTATQDEEKIDLALQRLNGDQYRRANLGNEALNQLFQDTDQVVSLFTDSPTKNQVDLDNLKKNPFELLLVGNGPKKTDEPAAAATASAGKSAEEAIVKRLRDDLNKLKLQSVISGGGRSLAVINGQVVREGEVVGEFTITAIGRLGVRLTAEGNTYTLTMDTGKGN
ncbi:MAG: hypothetical protein OER86_05315 [Phycisphaerae bacterium]|nr:hypothetical protein [Phycisphaerae bacterium]